MFGHQPNIINTIDATILEQTARCSFNVDFLELEITVENASE